MVLHGVLDAWRRDAIRIGSPSGAWAGIARTSLVILLLASIRTNFSDRVRPTPTQKRSSGSSNTIASSPVGVPITCRHTRYGRQASSTVM